MIANMRAEFRACALLLLIVTIYFTLVTGMTANTAATGPCLPSFPYSILKQGLLTVWCLTIVFLAVGYSINLFLRAP